MAMWIEHEVYRVETRQSRHADMGGLPQPTMTLYTQLGDSRVNIMQPHVKIWPDLETTSRPPRRLP
jgi:hypothetical protein